MTSTIDRPTRPAPRPPRRAAPTAPARGPRTAGALVALSAGVAGLLLVVLPVLLLWATDSRSGVGAVEVLRSGGRFWLVAHGVTLDVPGGRFALTPVGLLLVPLAVVARLASGAARRAELTGGRGVRRLALWTALPYGALAMVVALLCSGPDVHVSPVTSLVGGLLVGGFGAVVGAARPSRAGRAAWAALPRRSRRVLAGAGGATALLVGAGALLVAGSLVAHFPRAVELAEASAPGPVGGLALLLSGLALLPNAAVWGACWLAGPGVAVGVGTAVGPFGHELGPVPALPLLAALPGAGVPEWVAVLVLVVPLLAGAVAGRVVQADLADDDASWSRTAGEAALAGPVCGAVVGLLAWLSGGAAGGERLVQVGPSPWRVALAVTSAVAVGAVVAALSRRQHAQG